MRQSLPLAAMSPDIRLVKYKEKTSAERAQSPLQPTVSPVPQFSSHVDGLEAEMELHPQPSQEVITTDLEIRRQEESQVVDNEALTAIRKEVFNNDE